VEKTLLTGAACGCAPGRQGAMASILFLLPWIFAFVMYMLLVHGINVRGASSNSLAFPLWTFRLLPSTRPAIPGGTF